MKVKDILSPVIAKVTEYNKKKKHTIGRSDLADYVIRYEELITWDELDKLLAGTNLEVDTTNLERLRLKKIARPFKTFLSNRWERLKDYKQFHYTNTFNKELTQACLALATALADLKAFLHDDTKTTPPEPREPLHRFEFLMPGINFTNSVTRSNLNLEDAIEKLELHHFILDDQLRIIHIYDCLADARNDLKLKHSSALHSTGVQIPLSINDCYRVRFHSKHAHAAWETILKIEKHSATLNTIGGALTRLTLCLKNSGINGNLGGSDEKSAQAVHKGIKDFYEYFTSLTPEVQDAVYNLKSTEHLTGLFEFLFKKLLVMAYYDDEVNEKYLSEDELYDLEQYVENISQVRRLDASYLVADEAQRRQDALGVNLIFSCVDQMAIAINAIIVTKSAVLALSPDTTDFVASAHFSNQNSYEDRTLSVLQAQLDLQLSGVSNQSSQRYSKSDILKADVKKALYLDDITFLNTFSRKIVSTPKVFFEILNFIPYNFHRDFILECIKMRAIAKLFTTAESLISGIGILKLSNKEITEITLAYLIGQLGEKKLKMIFTEAQQLTALSNTLSFSFFMNILNDWLSADHVKTMFADDFAIRKFIEPFIETQSMMLCNFFNILYKPASEYDSTIAMSHFSLFKTSSNSAFKIKAFHPREENEEREPANKHIRLMDSVLEEEALSELLRSAPPRGPS